MQYMRLEPSEREALLTSLASMSDYLHAQFGALSAAEARVQGPAGAFSPVEQVWHLADLEHEGFAVRIRRLREEPHPQLPDFDGTRLARERDYRSRSLPEGLGLFSAARRANLATLRTLTEAEWTRSGTQAGVGTVSLCDMPGFLQQHDAAHRVEIEAWRRNLRGGV
jgi:DinB superfamily